MKLGGTLIECVLWDTGRGLFFHPSSTPLPLAQLSIPPSDHKKDARLHNLRLLQRNVTLEMGYGPQRRLSPFTCTIPYQFKQSVLPSTSVKSPRETQFLSKVTLSLHDPPHTDSHPFIFPPNGHPSVHTSPEREPPWIHQAASTENS